MTPTEDEIRAEAERLWNVKGQPEGQDEAIWLEAERILTAQGASKGRLDITEVADEMDAQTLRKKLKEWGITGTEHE